MGIVANILNRIKPKKVYTDYIPDDKLAISYTGKQECGLVIFDEREFCLHFRHGSFYDWKDNTLIFYGTLNLNSVDTVGELINKINGFPDWQACLKSSFSGDKIITVFSDENAAPFIKKLRGINDAEEIIKLREESKGEESPVAEG